MTYDNLVGIQWW